MASNDDEIADLRAEILRLRGLLAANGVDFSGETEAPAIIDERSNRKSFSTAEKIAVFRSFFRGRGDAFAVRWESAATGKSGYSIPRKILSQ